ncbi:glycosyltransferase family 2 protein [Vibrio cyclitrophicus]|uniref:glycosyltransferase family 2 protein n=1 Tax=Vibrio cyclitrophicus TaxID=47951 RepID=UPI000C819BC1|nr:glycosyltransferase family 2 protein [Vibrio cyclitrophicus]PMH57601.1 hypothetical protein BCU65_11645 [Vibrio cyclitrophicus]
MIEFPKVTYIVNTFNREKKLYNALDSIFDQDYPNLEIIVVDDHSDIDTSLSISEKYPDIKVIRNRENLGLSRSRQIGVENASSEIISFLDDDDILVDRDKTKRHVKILLENKHAALVCSNIMEVDDKGRNPYTIEWPEEVKAHLMKRNGIIFPSTTTVRKDSFINVAGFDSRFTRGVDSDVYRRLVLSDWTIIFENIITVDYLVVSNDKITNHASVSSIKKNIHSNLLTLAKYKNYYIAHPKSMLVRVRNIIRLSIRYLYQKLRES